MVLAAVRPDELDQFGSPEVLPDLGAIDLVIRQCEARMARSGNLMIPTLARCFAQRREARMPRTLRRGLRNAIVSLLSVSTVGLALLASMGAPASASPRFRPITCTGAFQQSSSSPVHLSGCLPRGVTGRSGQFQRDANDPNSTLTWKDGHVFTFGKGTVTVPSSSRCPSGSGTVEVDYVGTILSVSGNRTGPYLGKTIAYDACLTYQINVILVGLVPGTLLTIG